jgi:hypothetical protein
VEAGRSGSLGALPTAWCEFSVPDLFVFISKAMSILSLICFSLVFLFAFINAESLKTGIRIEPTGDPVQYISWVKVENTYHGWVRIPRFIYGAQRSGGLFYGTPHLACLKTQHPSLAI